MFTHFTRRALCALTAPLLMLSLASCGQAPGQQQALGRTGAMRAQAEAGTPFAKGFMWGVATAGYQYEGGDTTSNWAAWEREAGNVKQPIGQAIDHWNRYEADLDLAQGLGLNSYRLSIEWARVEPRQGQFDPAAVKHYHDVLAACQKRGLEPIVTLSHFAYPAWLDAKDADGRQGWESDRMVTEFGRYAGWAAREYGPQVKWWLTLNEPNTLGLVGFLAGVMPPGKHNPLAYNRVMGNQVKAHKVGFDQIHAADADAQVSINPVFIHFKPENPGDPAPRRLPRPQALWDEITFLDAVSPPKGKPGKRYLDYMAFNYFYALQFLDISKMPSCDRWPVYPEGILEVSRKLYARYQLPLMVTENGLATASDNPRADGWTREAYLVNHVIQLKRAVAEGIPLLGYMHWSLADNYEWGSFEPKFGLFGVDRRDPSLRRFRTPAADVYETIARANGATPALVTRFQGQRN